MTSGTFTQYPAGLFALFTNWIGDMKVMDPNDCQFPTGFSSHDAAFPTNNTTLPHDTTLAKGLSSLQCAYHSLPTLETSELCMIILPVACYWVYSTLLYILSWARLTSVELHRIPTDQKMRPANRITVAHVLKKVAVQHSIQIVVAYVLAVGTRPEDMASRPVEHPLLFVAKIVAASVMLDTYQYWMHRWMHTNRFLYRHFHSVHHELTVLYAYGALYNHPLEGLLMDTIGSGVPTVILDMHPWTSTVFFSLATLKTVDDHCGYALPWDPLQRFFRNNAVYHDIHHWGKGRMYNFSQPFFTFWDVWMGTDYEIAMQKKALAKAQNATVKTCDRVATANSEGITKDGLSKRRAFSDSLDGNDDSIPLKAPPSPSSSCSDGYNDSAIGSSCDWEASSHSSTEGEQDAEESTSLDADPTLLATSSCSETSWRATTAVEG